MPRNHNLGTSTLRNRNRVTNKTRLKVVQGNIDADPLVLDEDEEKARIVSTAGVDAEDANEHHLQAVLSASSHRPQSVGRTTRGAVADKAAAPAAFIPTPDSTGVVDNYEEIYRPAHWRQPDAYARFSDTVEESGASAIIDGFSYFMDERDKEWLDRNNEEARGEGTSAQGALSTSGTTTRSGLSQRSAKAKGKEPDCAQPVTISEDEFELVMGIFEKVTHDKTPFLHTSVESCMPFPPFSDYQDVFSSPLPASMFAAFAVPPWMPPPAQLLRLAKAIYPHWRERRTERGGHRIIPTLNFDETDTNESYICFRRREIKSVRKTRASQATSSDKLFRLQVELAQAHGLAKSLLERENLKKDNGHEVIRVWEKRLEFAELKRKFPSLSTKDEDELLHDKERVVKKPKVEAVGRLPGLKLRARDNDVASPIAAMEAVIRPKERLSLINAAMERDLARRKERDHGYEDVVENPYQRPTLPYPRRHWKLIPTSSRSTPSPDGVEDRDRKLEHLRYLRCRLTRLGGISLDRRDALQRLGIHDDDITSMRRRRSFGRSLEEIFDNAEDEEMARRLQERWRFDQDDDPAVAPEGAEEQDRMLVDDYDPKYLRHMMTLLTEQDQQLINNDATIYVLQDGRPHAVTPFRIAATLPVRKDTQNAQRGLTNGISPLAAPRQMSSSVPLPSVPNGMPISMQAHMKCMQPPATIPHMRISGGNIRPPATSNLAPILPPHQSSHQQSNADSSPTPASSASPTLPLSTDGDAVKASYIPNGASVVNGPTSNGSTQQTPEVSAPPTTGVQTATGSPPRQKADIQQPISLPLNGYHSPINGYAIPNGAYMQAPRQPNGLSPQPTQNSRMGLAPGQDPTSAIQGTPGRQIQAYLVPNGTHFNMQLGAGINVNLKPPPGRQWNGSPMQQTPTLGNGQDVGGVTGLSSPHNSPGILPTRTPSANGNRAVGRPGIMGAVQTTTGHLVHGGQYPALSLSPRLQHNSPSPLPNATLALPPHQTPPRPPPTPAMKMSPSIQHQQPVPSSQGGY